MSHIQGDSPLNERNRAGVGPSAASEDALHGGGERYDNTAQPHLDQGPLGPLWRLGPNSQTSMEGAQFAATRAGTHKDQILNLLEAGEASPEEMATKFASTGERILLNTIRARCSDLYRVGRVRPSGTFGRGESGKVRVIRWRLSTPDELSIFHARKAAEDEKGPGE